MNKKIFITAFLLLLFAGAQFVKADKEISKPQNLSQPQRLQYFNSSYKYSIVDKNGKLLTETKYDLINVIDENCIAVYIDKKWGFLDSSGKYIIKPQFSLIKNLSDKLTSVLLDNKWGIIDRKGSYIVEPKFEEINVDKQKIKVKIDNKYGFIDFNGNYIIKPEFANIGYFTEGLAPAKIADKFGYINEKGEIVIQPQFDEAESFFRRGILPQSLKSNTPIGQPAVNNLKQPAEVEDKSCSVTAKVKSNGKYGIINNAGEYIIKPQYDSLVFNYNSGLISVKSDNKWGLIDINGNVIVEPKFDEIAPNFYNDIIAVKIDNKWGCIDKTGKYIITLASDTPITYNNGFAVIANKVATAELAQANNPRGSVPQKAEVIGELHVVNPIAGTGKYSNIPGQEPIILANLNLKVINKPVTLLLNSYNSVEWHLKLDEGVQLKKIIMTGYHKCKIANLPANTELQILDKYLDIDTKSKEEYTKTQKSILQLTGKEAKTIQAIPGSGQNTIIINGLKDDRNYLSLAVNPPNSFAKVNFVCEMPSWHPNKCGLSADKLTAFLKDSNRSYRTNRYYSSGKWYYETQINVGQGSTNPDYETNTGVWGMESGRVYSVGFPGNFGGEDRSISYPSIGKDLTAASVKNKDIIGVALDLDNHKIFIRKNGVWVNGNPDLSTGGTEIKSDKNYYPAVSISWPSRDNPEYTDYWTANFGRKPFKFNVPKGYRPYDDPALTKIEFDKFYGSNNLPIHRMKKGLNYLNGMIRANKARTGLIPANYRTVKELVQYFAGNNKVIYESSPQTAHFENYNFTDNNGIKYWILWKRGTCINKNIIDPDEDINCLMFMDINGNNPPNELLSDQFRIIIQGDRVLSAEEYFSDR